MTGGVPTNQLRQSSVDLSGNPFVPLMRSYPDREIGDYNRTVQFTKRLRERIRSGEITCSVRIWMRPHVKVGGRYKMGDGEVEVEAILPIQLADITPALARKSGFDDVADLLATAKHGPGESVYLVHFRYVRPRKRTKRNPR